MLRVMKEFKNMKRNPDHNRDGELWCTDYREEGHTKGSCPKNQFRYLPDCGKFHEGMLVQYEKKWSPTSVIDVGSVHLGSYRNK